MEDENIVNFVSITSCEPEKAAQYLRLTEGNFEQAIQLFFDSPNLDLGGATASAPAQTAPSASRNPITIDSDDDMSDFDPTAHTSNASARPPPAVEDDEAMARRLQDVRRWRPGW
jgi:hypothetical protein